jgi:hypothetical protein
MDSDSYEKSSLIMKLLLFILLLTSNLLARDIIIDNETGLTIYQLYLSGTNDWGPIRLPRALADHTKVIIDADGLKLANMKAVFLNNQVITWTGNNAFDLTVVHKITFQQDRNRILAHYE